MDTVVVIIQLQQEISDMQRAGLGESEHLGLTSLVH